MTPGERLDTLEKVRHSAGGMLLTHVYEAIFDVGARSRGGTFVEIGTAHGAATIALALGARQQAAPYQIYTADLFSGKHSSRSRYGSVERNLEIVKSNFDAFGVGANISVIAGSSAELVAAFNPTDIRVLIIDADGRIDRDLAVFYDRLAPGCTVILDDIDGELKMLRTSGGLILDQKHRIGQALVERFIEHDVLRELNVIDSTGFYLKGEASSPRFAEMSLPAYRELVFADIENLRPDRLSVKGWLVQRFPALAMRYKRTRRRLKGT